MQRAFATSLRDQLLAAIEARGWDQERVAEESGLLVEGVRVLYARERWDMASAELIADALGMTIVPQVVEAQAAGR